MRDFSKVYTDLWQSEKFGALEDNFSRLVYLYILTCPHSNSAGCYDLKPGYATTDLRCDLKAFGKAIFFLSEAGLIEIHSPFQTILITNWVTFNEPTNAKHAMGIIGQLKGIGSPVLKYKRGQEFSQLIEEKNYFKDKRSGKHLQKLCECYQKPFETVSPPRPETESKTKSEREVESAPLENGHLHEALQAVQSSWNLLAADTGIPKVQNMTDSRRSAIPLRLAEIGGLEGWYVLLDKIRGSPMLRGQNDRGWTATFDWVLLPKNCVKIMEGNYDGGKRTRDPNSPQAAIDDLLDRVGQSDRDPRR